MWLWWVVKLFNEMIFVCCVVCNSGSRCVVSVKCLRWLLLNCNLKLLVVVMCFGGVMMLVLLISRLIGCLLVMSCFFNVVMDVNDDRLRVLMVSFVFGIVVWIFLIVVLFLV